MTRDIRKMNRILLWIAVAVMADGVTTMYAVTNGLPEGNPLGRLLTVDGSLLARVVCVILLYFAINHRPVFGWERRITIVLWITFVITWLVVVTNFIVIAMLT